MSARAASLRRWGAVMLRSRPSRPSSSSIVSRVTTGVGPRPALITNRRDEASAGKGAVSRPRAIAKWPRVEIADHMLEFATSGVIMPGVACGGPGQSSRAAHSLPDFLADLIVLPSDPISHMRIQPFIAGRIASTAIRYTVGQRRPHNLLGRYRLMPFARHKGLRFL